MTASSFTPSKKRQLSPSENFPDGLLFAYPVSVNSEDHALKTNSALKGDRDTDKHEMVFALDI